MITDSGGKTELELNGERLTVEGWPSGLSEPPGEVSANGERVVFRLAARDASPSVRPLVPGPAAHVPSRGDAVAESPEAVVTPMPGKVIEVRVAEGTRVTAGHVLLVVEAMKMRNEIVSPRDGIVRDLRVQAGANVRAREPLLRVAPV